MNYRISIDPVAIATTGAAVDNATVFGSLKMARVALDEAVSDEIRGIAGDLEKGVLSLKHAAGERISDLRAARKAALKIREADLPSDTPSAPPAAPAAAEPSQSGPSPQEPAVETTAQPPDSQAQGNEADSPGAASRERERAAPVLSAQPAHGPAEPATTAGGEEAERSAGHLAAEPPAGGGEPTVVIGREVDLLAVPAFLRRSRTR